MQISVFPCTYNEHVDENAKIKVERAKVMAGNRISSIEKTYKGNQDGGMVGCGVGVTLGLFVGIIPCTCTMALSTNPNESVSAGFCLYFLTLVIGGMIGFFWAEHSRNLYQFNEIDKANRIGAERKALGKEIERIYSEADTEKQEYYTKFEKNAQNMCVQFEESDLTKEVITWMTNDFFCAIEAADRSDYNEKILVPFSFRVYKNRITYDSEVFDFTQKRWRNLKSPLEQTALAMTIASEIQSNINRNYSEDVSGTQVSISISYSYTYEYPIATLIYSAPNGYYKPVQSW